MIRNRVPIRRVLLCSIGVVALVVTVLGVGLRVGPRPVRAQTTGDQSLLMQLAQRLLSQQFPPYTYAPIGSSAPSTAVQLYPGALAPDFPSDVPMPPNSTLIGSDEHPTNTPVPPFVGGTTGSIVAGPQTSSTGTHVDVVLDDSGSADDVTSFYTGALANLGWSSPPNFNVGQIGFIASSTPGVPVTYCQSSDGPSLTMTARTTNGGPLDVRLVFDTSAPQCRAFAASTPSIAPPIPGFGVMPALKGPQGVTVYSGGGSGGSATRFSTDAVAATTDMSAGDLHAFYANELVAAGWTEASSGGDAFITWSTWTIPDHSDLQGFLYVRNGPAAGQRALHLEVASTDPNAVTSCGVYYPCIDGSGFSGPTLVSPGVTPAPAPAVTPTPGQ